MALLLPASTINAIVDCAQTKDTTKMVDRLNVLVLMGGRDSEHDISIKTGTVVTNALDRKRYNIKPVQITREGRWLIPSGFLSDSGDRADWLPWDESQPSHTDVSVGEVANYSIDMALVRAEELGIDVVFVALHGREGEGGAIQGLLETVGFPYTGSDVLGSALAMDKVRSKQLISFDGLSTPAFAAVTLWRWQSDADVVVEWVDQEIGYPAVVKIPDEGSSFGMAICKTEASFREHIGSLLQQRPLVMVEEYIKGTEITCAVLGGLVGEEPTALPLIEIVPKTSEYFDFEAKYTPGATEEICPARIDDALTAQAQHMGVRAHELLGLEGMSRTDMIVREGQIYYLESNTIPGMTETSLYPQAAEAAGMTFPALLDRQIELAIARKP